MDATMKHGATGLAMVEAELNGSDSLLGWGLPAITLVSVQRTKSRATDARGDIRCVQAALDGAVSVLDAE